MKEEGLAHGIRREEEEQLGETKMETVKSVKRAGGKDEWMGTRIKER